MNIIKKIIKGNFEYGKWFNDCNKVISIRDFRGIRKENLKEYGNDPDINIKRRWGISTNGAKRGVKEHKCLDVTFELGHIVINYTNYSFNKKYQ